MLAGKVIVVAGGAGLLGRAFCDEVACQHGTVVVADFDRDAADGVARNIGSVDGVAEAASLDITSRESVQRLLTKVTATHGRIDGVVNSAYPRNAHFGRKVEDVTYADFCENMALHLGGYFLMSQCVALHFRANGGGSLVNLASIYGVIAPRFELYSDTGMTMPVEYAAIKAGIIQLTRYFAQHFKADGVRCNSLSPGGILDGQPDQFLERYGALCGSKGMLDAEDVAGTLTFLLSDASRHVTGQNLIVDDGFSL